MAYEQRDNSGSLFKNDRKDKSSQPDYTGNALIDGSEYRLSAWIKDGKSGKFMSLAFTPKDELRATKSAAPKTNVREAMDDEIPF